MITAIIIWLAIGYMGSVCGIYNFQGCQNRKRDIFAQWLILPVFCGVPWGITMMMMAFTMWME